MRLSLVTVCLSSLSLLVAACEGGGPAVDAAMPISSHTAAVSLRIDVAPGKAASFSVLAFRAAFSGMPATDVLGMVDPLAAAAPARDCLLRDADRVAASSVARGDSIELEELPGVGIDMDESTATVRPSARLYPDLAATIGGVVGEAGPFSLTTVPSRLRVQGAVVDDGTTTGAAPDQANVDVPATAWIRSINGATPRDGLVISIATDMNLAVDADAAPETFVEVRPFGATIALSCAIPTTARGVGGQPPAFAVSHAALAALVSASGATPGTSIAAGLDVVRRTTRQLPLSATPVLLEVRTSTFVELHP